MESDRAWSMDYWRRGAAFGEAGKASYETKDGLFTHGDAIADSEGRPLPVVERACVNTCVGSLSEEDTSYSGRCGFSMERRTYRYIGMIDTGNGLVPQYVEE